MKRIRYPAAVLIAFEAAVIVFTVWISFQDLRRLAGVEQTAIACLFVLSVLALLVASFVLRNAAPGWARLGWVILFCVFLAAMLLPPI